MDPNRPASLPEQLDELRARVQRLEEAFDRHGIARPADETARAGTIPPEAAGAAGYSLEGRATPAGTAVPIANAGQKRMPAESDGRSLESRIGSHWFNRIGILAVLVGMAWFLKFAIDSHWIGPLARVLIGLAAGVALIVWSERFRRRGFAGFGYSLIAAGSGILYLSLWAAYSLFHLLPSGAALTAMVLVTALNGTLSWARDAEVLAFYSIAGGLATPLLLPAATNHQAALFTYLLLLDIAVLTLVTLRPWPRLLLGAFTGTALWVASWWWQYYSAAQSGRTAFFLTCFFLLFAFAPRLFRANIGRASPTPANSQTAVGQSGTISTGWNSLALVLLPAANAGLGFLGFYGIVSSSGDARTAPYLALAFAIFYLSLFRFLRPGIPAILPPLHLGAAIVFLILAIPLETHGRWLTIGWLAEGVALLWAAGRVRLPLLRVLATACLALGLIALISIAPPASATPFLNQRFATFCAGIVSFALVAWMAAQRGKEESLAKTPFWSVLALTAPVVVNILILLAVGCEIHSYWSRAGGAAWRSVRDARMGANFTYSAFFMLFGGLLLAAGFWRRSAPLRWQALLLLAATIAKVFLVDISRLSQGYRITSFLGLGALLLAISFLYQHDLLNLRGTGRRSG